jgi:MFS family permease
MSSSATKKKPIQMILQKDFVLLLFIMFVGSTGQQFFQSIMTKYAVSLNCPEALVGIVVTAYAVMVFISSLISGVVSDRMQKKTLLIISIAGQALSTIGYAIIGESLVLLLAIRMVHGFCFGLNMVVTMSMVSFFLPREVLGVGMGVYGLGQTLAMGIGPSIGLSLVNSVGYRNMFLIAFVFTFSATILSLFVRPIPIVKKEQSKFRFKDLIDMKTVPVSLIGLCNAVAYASVTAFLVIHAESRGVVNIGLFFTIYAVTLLAVRPIMGRAADKYPLRYTIYPANVLILVSLVMIAAANSLWMFLVAAVLLGIGFGGAQPVLQAESLRGVSPDRRGAASATYTMGQSSGFAIGPMVAGFLSVPFGYGNMFLAMSLSSILGIAVLFFRERYLSNSSADSLSVETE